MEDKRDKLKSELEQLAPELISLDEQKGFVVPDQYFEQLKNEILEQVTKEQGDHSSDNDRNLKPIRIINPYWIWSAAASIILAMGFLYYCQKTVTVGSTNNYAFNGAEGVQYIIDHLEEFDEDEWTVVEEIVVSSFSPELIMNDIEEPLDINLDHFLDDLNDEELNQLFEEFN